MPTEFKLIDFKDIFKTNYLYKNDKEIIDDWFEIDRHESIPLRLKNTPYYIKKLKEREFKNKLNEL